MTEVAQTFGPTFFLRYKICINFDESKGWATFWAIFLQTHLVTLVLDIISSLLFVLIGLATFNEVYICIEHRQNNVEFEQHTKTTK
jgi:hypothetical protein